jgi:hypothetical protein
VVTSAVDDAEGSHPAAPSATTNVRVAMPTNGLLTPDAQMPTAHAAAAH